MNKINLPIESQFEGMIKGYTKLRPLCVATIFDKQRAYVKNVIPLQLVLLNRRKVLKYYDLHAGSETIVHLGDIAEFELSSLPRQLFTEMMDWARSSATNLRNGSKDGLFKKIKRSALPQLTLEYFFLGTHVLGSETYKRHESLVTATSVLYTECFVQSMLSSMEAASETEVRKTLFSEFDSRLQKQIALYKRCSSVLIDDKNIRASLAWLATERLLDIADVPDQGMLYLTLSLYVNQDMLGLLQNIKTYLELAESCRPA